MYKIVIVEDDENIREELQQLLVNALYEVSWIEEFQRVAKQILNLNPDLVLLDMNLPNQDGLGICGELRKTSQVPIIFVTSNVTSMDELNCITRGGDDYITKPYQPPILLARIAAVLKRSAPKKEEQEVQLTYREVTLELSTGKLKRENVSIDLTKNEIKIVYYLFRKAGCIIAREELMDYLWDNQIFIDDNTLSVNITRIRAKLKELGAGEYITTKRGLGYLLE
ncbi:response regulator transcription factor [Anaerosporobacter faecicola]|uniref:response regulator transcription factor n=1 Tax=Anaerosporobacter faecicola TaxID=2718714 RepID=UPI00143B7FA0|nr:response regulator transcription factor [Anaerosporobacter faecicola]